MTPQAVILDIGNVLIEWQPERYYDSIMPQAERVRMFAEVDLHGMNEAIDKGALFRETIYATAEAHPRWREPIRQWFDNWIDLASPVIAASVALQRALRAKGVPVFALTNFGIHSFAFAQTQYDFLNEFDRYYVSGRMGVTKPDPEMFARLQADCGLPPEALLFTDDRPGNIAAAKSRGWGVHLFEGPKGWAERLVAEGLLDRGEAGL